VKWEMARVPAARSMAIFFLDAVRFLDITPENTPFLMSLTREGISGPLETLLAYEGIGATIFTGTYPTEHGVWTRYYLDPEASPFRWISPFSSVLEKLNGSTTSSRGKIVRYGVMKLSTLLAGISFFPGLDEVPFKSLAQLSFSIKRNLFEPHCFGKMPSLFDILNASGVSYRYFDHELFDRDFTVFARAVGTRNKYDVRVVRFVDLDTISHRYGLGSKERSDSLRRTDEFVREIVSKWREEDPQLAVVCFADHGMVKVREFVDLEETVMSSGLVPFDDFGMFLDSTLARFWGEPEKLANIRNALSKLECGRFLTAEERSGYRIPASASWGQLIFLLEPGYVISPNFFEKTSHVKAMHGYDPGTPGLETFCLVNSSGLSSSRRFSKMRMVDVLPTTLDVLGLAAPPHCQGVSFLDGGTSS